MCTVTTVPLILLEFNIIGVVTWLHKGKCGVPCGIDMVSGLLFADDTSLIASDREGLKGSLDFCLSGVKSGG